MWLRKKKDLLILLMLVVFEAIFNSLNINLFERDQLNINGKLHVLCNL